MSLWILASLIAAAVQTIRFMLQKILAGGALSAAGATFARFLYSAPIAVSGVALYLAATEQNLPLLGAAFWMFCLAGGAAQVVATICLVTLFQERNFAVGLTFSKTEVLITVGVGLVILGDRVTLVGLICILLGVIGVVLLSVDPATAARGMRRVLTRALGLGVAAGLLFSVSAVSYRGASLALLSDDPFLRAGATLAAVTTLQMVGMALWLRWREVGEVGRVIGAWRTAGFVGITSVVGSFGWFTAFTLQNAAYVKAVGQVELIFGLLASALFFRERLTMREVLGMAIVSLSVLGVVLGAGS